MTEPATQTLVALHVDDMTVLVDALAALNPDTEDAECHRDWLIDLLSRRRDALALRLAREQRLAAGPPGDLL